jgi:hypothetical protein
MLRGHSLLHDEPAVCLTHLATALPVPMIDPVASIVDFHFNYVWVNEWTKSLLLESRVIFLSGIIRFHFFRTWLNSPSRTQRSRFCNSSSVGSFPSISKAKRLSPYRELFPIPSSKFFLPFVEQIFLHMPAKRSRRRCKW